MLLIIKVQKEKESWIVSYFESERSMEKKGIPTEWQKNQKHKNLPQVANPNARGRNTDEGEIIVNAVLRVRSWLLEMRDLIR